MKVNICIIHIIKFKSKEKNKQKEECASDLSQNASMGQPMFHSISVQWSNPL